MPEIETEVKYRAPDFDGSVLEDFDLEEDYSQVDHYLTPPHEDFSGDTVNYLRVREYGDGRCSFDRHIVKSDRQTVEHEVEFEDSVELLELLETLGFEEYVTVRKEREVYDAGKFDIVVDRIDGLGTFVELELTGERQEDRLEELTERLGLEPGNEVVGKGYPDLLMEQD